jgi:DNA-directed RNA polymerase specialized sigma24 family protein
MNPRRADFERFVADSSHALLRTAYLIVWDLGEAEDLVQETLFEVARRWPRIRRMERPLAYARRILVNRALRGSARRTRRCWFIAWWPGAQQLESAELTTPAGSSTQKFDLPAIPGGCNTNKDCPNGGSAQAGETNINGGRTSGQLKGESVSSSQ